jgi:hypothetical protein
MVRNPKNIVSPHHSMLKNLMVHNGMNSITINVHWNFLLNAPLLQGLQAEIQSE